MVRLARSAFTELNAFRAADRARITKAMRTRLAEQPTVVGGAVKRLQGEGEVWQLRVGDFRIFYDVQGEVVTVLGIRRKGRKTTGEIR